MGKKKVQGLSRTFLTLVAKFCFGDKKMEQALQIATSVIHKNLIIKVQRVRTGPKGHGLLAIIRLLVYAVLKEYFHTRFLEQHLRKRPRVWRALGFASRPSRAAIDRWKRQHIVELREIISLLGDEYLAAVDAHWTILDSTTLEDYADPDARWGNNSKGRFKGFKLHISVDERSVPLRASFTTGNVADCTQGKALLAPTPYNGGDAGYDVQELKDASRDIGSTPVFVHNPRREGKEKKRKTPKKLKKVRVKVEQANSIIKHPVMREMWFLVKGFKQKATLAFASVLALQAFALHSLRTWGYPSLRISEAKI